MRIALDTLGGQNAPEAAVEGAVMATRRWDNLTICLVGDSRTLPELLNRWEADVSRFTFLESPVRVDETESPVEALTSKPGASIFAALEAHHRGEVEAVVSAGSTGAQIVGSIQSLGLLEGVKRPAIGSFFPTLTGKTFLIDVGANVDCRPIHLLQFAAMGAILRRHLEGLHHPRIALLSNGEESTKGSHATREAYELMSIVPALNFVGNIEGRDLFAGRADVVVCDGFTGNVILKFAESIPDIFAAFTQGENRECGPDPSALERLTRSFDYQELGGVPLLGVNGVSIICHGRSTAKAISSAIGEAIKMVNFRVNHHIREQIITMGQWSATVKGRALIDRFRRRSSGEKN
ncbi:MAG: phosphate acyltransferase PlsX [Candidatus Zixiibacteriota bacterium]|nr:MAG: phosphate acyltransferase PlsX [candidate division Zixibacteria bacterium]